MDRPKAVWVAQAIDFTVSGLALVFAGLCLWVTSEPLLQDAWTYVPGPAAFGVAGVWIGCALGRSSHVAAVAQYVWSVLATAGIVAWLVRRASSLDRPTMMQVLVIALLLLAILMPLVLLALPDSRKFIWGTRQK